MFSNKPVILIPDCDMSKKRIWNIILYNIPCSEKSKVGVKSSPKVRTPVLMIKYWIDQVKKRQQSLIIKNSRKFKVIVFIIVCLW